MNRAVFSLVSLVSFVLIGCSSCAGRPDNGLRHVRIAVGGQNQMVYLPTTLAQELGFYRDEGIDAELQDFAGGAKALQALVGGSADVVSGFYDHTIQMAAEGREFVAFVTMLRFPGARARDLAAERRHADDDRRSERGTSPASRPQAPRRRCC